MTRKLGPPPRRGQRDAHLRVTVSGFLPLQRPGVRMLIRADLAGHADRLGYAGLPTSAHVVRGGRADHPVVDLPGGPRVVVRRYLRGGLLRHLNRDRYLLGERSFAELRTLAHAVEHGVGVPVPVAATEFRSGFGYRALLATEWVPDSADLAAWLASGTDAPRAPVLARVGGAIARMHAAGVAHADLNLRNVLVTPAGVCLLDFDRATLAPAPVGAARRHRELARFARSARKLQVELTTADWDALRDGYGSGWPDFRP